MNRIAVLTLPLLLSGCGAATTAGSAPTGDDAPTTPAALAAIASQYVGEPDRASEGSNWGSAFRGSPLQAELRYRTTGEYDGDAVQVVVGRLQEPIATCADLSGRVSGCVDIEDGVWAWQEEAPEEDPGVVFVVQHKEKVTALVAYYGPVITGDPRNQDLPIEVETLVDLAADERVDATTSTGAVDDGGTASYWQD